MYNFSLYISDLAAAGFEEKMNVCNQFMINNMEIEDEIDGKKLVEMDGEALEKCRSLLIQWNKKIVLMNSSISISDIAGIKILFRKALMLGVENIRILPGITAAQLNNVSAGESHACLCGVAGELDRVCGIGRSYGIGVLVENNFNTCLDTEERIAAIFKEMGGVKPGWIFNPLEFTKNRAHPFFHIFYNSRLKQSIGFLRVNDGLFTEGRPLLPGQGNAEIKELASALLARGFKGYFSFIPYFEGMGMDAYAQIMKAFKKLLMEM